MRKSGFTLLELLIASVVLMVLAAIAIPNFVDSYIRAREAEVKTVAYAVQMAVEDYKVVPGQEAVKPTTVAQFLTYLPGNVLSKRNPFGVGGTYGSGEIVDGAPAAEGRVGYISGGTMPYKIIAQGKNHPSPRYILTLMEGQ